MTWMSVDLIIHRCRLFCKPAAVKVQSQQELWNIWVVQRFIRLLYLKRLLISIMSDFILRRILYPVFACSRPQCFFWKIGMRMRKNKENWSVFSLASNCSDHWKKRLYNQVFKIKVRSLISLMIILLGTNVSYWRNSHVFLDRSS